MIKGLCAALARDRERRDSGLALLEAFDAIDLLALQDAASNDAAVKNISPVQAMSETIRLELDRLLPRRAAAQRSDFGGREAPAGNEIAVKFRSKPPGNGARPVPVNDVLAGIACGKNHLGEVHSDAVLSKPQPKPIRRPR